MIWSSCNFFLPLLLFCHSTGQGYGAQHAAPLANVLHCSTPGRQQFRLDIHRAADLLIKRDGEDASIFAAMQGDKRLEARDMEGGAVWRWVTRAVKELLDENPPAADTGVH